MDALSGSAATGAAIKADCYGLGVDTCLPVLRDAGAAGFFVAHWSEVPGALAYVPGEKIAVLHGPLHDADCSFARATGAVPVINSLEQARRWTSSGGGPCHLMVDTGINRLGIAPGEAGDPSIAALEVDVLMSHLASADEDSDRNAQQSRRFAEIAQSLPHKRTSLANSAGIALDEGFHHDLTRPGLSLYGGIARAELGSRIRQVAFPQAAILQTRQLGTGDAVGYNGEFVAPSPTPTAIVSLGYADGFLRGWGGAYLIHEGRKLPLLGKVSMDMVVVDLSAAPELAEGDWLDLPYYLPDAARLSGLSQYEALTVLGRRFRR
ncbi:Alanine racemase [Alteripontixanthobacter maritimus]|uniref:alanine racemase n=2 Tax=Alteripontixanthobacter maritimus TaxID=2161824 RepID=A0A369Q9L5_9SPHN|nr:Alanine racemase [Alteripontixanthobacter maritimus]